MIWISIKCNCAKAEKAHRAVSAKRVGHYSDSMETLLPLCSHCEKQCVSEKSSGKECISRCISRDFSWIRPVAMVGAGSATVCWVRLMIRFRILLLIMFGSSLGCLG